MEHRIFGKKLGRTHNQRQALLKGIVRQMFTHGSINTTEAKAKSALRLVESLSSVAVKGDLNSRRELFRYLQDRHWVNRVVAGLTTAFADQKSNFIKITKVKRRQGDDAIVVNMAFVKPVTFTPVIEAEPKKADKVKKTTAKKTAAKKPAAKAKAVKSVKTK